MDNTIYSRVPDIDKTELSDEIRKYQQTGVVSLNLSYMMRNIAHKMAMTRKWCGYPKQQLEEMESEAFVWMVRWAIKSAKPENNCFAYLMSAASSAFCRYLKKQERNEKSKLAMRKLISAEIGNEHYANMMELAKEYAEFETEDGEV